MRIGESIIIQTIDPADTKYVNTVGKTTQQIFDEVKEAVVELYRKGNECFEEFIEVGELEISGLPLNLQALLFAQLKQLIDRDTVIIHSEDFGDCSLEQYLLIGPEEGRK